MRRRGTQLPRNAATSPQPQPGDDSGPPGLNASTSAQPQGHATPGPPSRRVAQQSQARSAPRRGGAGGASGAADTKDLTSANTTGTAAAAGVGGAGGVGGHALATGGAAAPQSGTGVGVGGGGLSSARMRYGGGRIPLSVVEVLEVDRDKVVSRLLESVSGKNVIVRAFTLERGRPEAGALVASVRANPHGAGSSLLPTNSPGKATPGGASTFGPPGKNTANNEQPSFSIIRYQDTGFFHIIEGGHTRLLCTPKRASDDEFLEFMVESLDLKTHRDSVSTVAQMSSGVRLSVKTMEDVWSAVRSKAKQQTSSYVPLQSSTSRDGLRIVDAPASGPHVGHHSAVDAVGDFWDVAAAGYAAVLPTAEVLLGPTVAPARAGGENQSEVAEEGLDEQSTIGATTTIGEREQESDQYGAVIFRETHTELRPGNSRAITLPPTSLHQRSLGGATKNPSDKNTSPGRLKDLHGSGLDRAGDTCSQNGGSGGGGGYVERFAAMDHDGVYFPVVAAADVLAQRSREQQSVNAVLGAVSKLKREVGDHANSIDGRIANALPLMQAAARCLEIVASPLTTDGGAAAAAASEAVCRAMKAIAENQCHSAARPFARSITSLATQRLAVSSSFLQMDQSALPGSSSSQRSGAELSPSDQRALTLSFGIVPPTLQRELRGDTWRTLFGDATCPFLRSGRKSNGANSGKTDGGFSRTYGDRSDSRASSAAPGLRSRSATSSLGDGWNSTTGTFSGTVIGSGRDSDAEAATDPSVVASTAVGNAAVAAAVRQCAVALLQSECALSTCASMSRAVAPPLDSDRHLAELGLIAGTDSAQWTAWRESAEGSAGTSHRTQNDHSRVDGGDRVDGENRDVTNMSGASASMPPPPPQHPHGSLLDGLRHFSIDEAIVAIAGATAALDACHAALEDAGPYFVHFDAMKAAALATDFQGGSQAHHHAGDPATSPVESFTPGASTSSFPAPPESDALGFSHIVDGHGGGESRRQTALSRTRTFFVQLRNLYALAVELMSVAAQLTRAVLELWRNATAVVLTEESDIIASEQKAKFLRKQRRAEERTEAMEIDAKAAAAQDEKRRARGIAATPGIEAKKELKDRVELEFGAKFDLPGLPAFSKQVVDFMKPSRPFSQATPSQGGARDGSTSTALEKVRQQHLEEDARDEEESDLLRQDIARRKAAVLLALERAAPEVTSHLRRAVARCSLFMIPTAASLGAAPTAPAALRRAQAFTSSRGHLHRKSSKSTGRSRSPAPSSSANGATTTNGRAGNGSQRDQLLEERFGGTDGFTVRPAKGSFIWAQVTAAGFELLAAVEFGRCALRSIRDADVAAAAHKTQTTSPHAADTVGKDATKSSNNGRKEETPSLRDGAADADAEADADDPHDRTVFSGRADQAGEASYAAMLSRHRAKKLSADDEWYCSFVTHEWLLKLTLGCGPAASDCAVIGLFSLYHTLRAVGTDGVNSLDQQTKHVDPAAHLSSQGQGDADTNGMNRLAATFGLSSSALSRPSRRGMKASNSTMTELQSQGQRAVVSPAQVWAAVLVVVKRLRSVIPSAADGPWKAAEGVAATMVGAGVAPRTGPFFQPLCVAAAAVAAAMESIPALVPPSSHNSETGLSSALSNHATESGSSGSMPRVPDALTFFAELKERTKTQPFQSTDSDQHAGRTRHMNAPTVENIRAFDYDAGDDSSGDDVSDDDVGDARALGHESAAASNSLSRSPYGRPSARTPARISGNRSGLQATASLGCFGSVSFVSGINTASSTATSSGFAGGPHAGGLAGLSNAGDIDPNSIDGVIEPEWVSSRNTELVFSKRFLGQGSDWRRQKLCCAEAPFGDDVGVGHERPPLASDGEVQPQSTNRNPSLGRHRGLNSDTERDPDGSGGDGNGDGKRSGGGDPNSAASARTKSKLSQTLSLSSIAAEIAAFRGRATSSSRPRAGSRYDRGPLFSASKNNQDNRGTQNDNAPAVIRVKSRSALLSTMTTGGTSGGGGNEALRVQSEIAARATPYSYHATLGRHSAIIAGAQHTNLDANGTESTAVRRGDGTSATSLSEVLAAAEAHGPTQKAERRTARLRRFSAILQCVGNSTIVAAHSERNGKNEKGAHRSDQGRSPTTPSVATNPLTLLLYRNTTPKKTLVSLGHASALLCPSLREAAWRGRPTFVWNALLALSTALHKAGVSHSACVALAASALVGLSGLPEQAQRLTNVAVSSRQTDLNSTVPSPMASRRSSPAASRTVSRTATPTRATPTPFSITGQSVQTCAAGNLGGNGYKDRLARLAATYLNHNSSDALDRSSAPQFQGAQREKDVAAKAHHAASSGLTALTKGFALFLFDWCDVAAGFAAAPLPALTFTADSSMAKNQHFTASAADGFNHDMTSLDTDESTGALLDGDRSLLNSADPASALLVDTPPGSRGPSRRGTPKRTIGGGKPGVVGGHVNHMGGVENVRHASPVLSYVRTEYQDVNGASSRPGGIAAGQQGVRLHDTPYPESAYDAGDQPSFTARETYGRYPNIPTAVSVASSMTPKPSHGNLHRVAGRHGSPGPGQRFQDHLRHGAAHSHRPGEFYDPLAASTGLSRDASSYYEGAAGRGGHQPGPGVLGAMNDSSSHYGASHSTVGYGGAAGHSPHRVSDASAPSAGGGGGSPLLHLHRGMSSVSLGGESHGRAGSPIPLPRDTAPTPMTRRVRSRLTSVVLPTADGESLGSLPRRESSTAFSNVGGKAARSGSTLGDGFGRRASSHQLPAQRRPSTTGPTNSWTVDAGAGDTARGQTGPNDRALDGESGTSGSIPHRGFGAHALGYFEDEGRSSLESQSLGSVPSPHSQHDGTQQRGPQHRTDALMDPASPLIVPPPRGAPRADFNNRASIVSSHTAMPSHSGSETATPQNREPIDPAINDHRDPHHHHQGNARSHSWNPSGPPTPRRPRSDTQPPSRLEAPVRSHHRTGGSGSASVPETTEPSSATLGISVGASSIESLSLPTAPTSAFARAGGVVAPGTAASSGAVTNVDAGAGDDDALPNRPRRRSGGGTMIDPATQRSPHGLALGSHDRQSRDRHQASPSPPQHRPMPSRRGSRQSSPRTSVVGPQRGPAPPVVSIPPMRHDARRGHVPSDRSRRGSAASVGTSEGRSGSSPRSPHHGRSSGRGSPSLRRDSAARSFRDVVPTFAAVSHAEDLRALPLDVLAGSMVSEHSFDSPHTSPRHTASNPLRRTGAFPHQHSPPPAGSRHHQHDVSANQGGRERTRDTAGDLAVSGSDGTVAPLPPPDRGDRGTAGVGGQVLSSPLMSAFRGASVTSDGVGNDSFRIPPAGYTVPRSGSDGGAPGESVVGALPAASTSLLAASGAAPSGGGMRRRRGSVVASLAADYS